MKNTHRSNQAARIAMLGCLWLATIGPAVGQVPTMEPIVRLNEDHRLQTSLWNRCYVQHRPDGHELITRLTHARGAGSAESPLMERTQQQRDRMWKEAVERAESALQATRGDRAVRGEPQRPFGQRPGIPATPGPLARQSLDFAPTAAVKASATMMALSNESPRTLESVSRLLGEMASLAGTNATQEVACLKLLVDNMVRPRGEDENVQQLLAILKMRPEVLQVHPMYGRSVPRSAQPLSCAIGLHLVTSLLGKGLYVEGRRLAGQVLSDVRGSIGSVNPQRIRPMQLDCGYFTLVAGNLEMMGVGGEANPVLADELFRECEAFVDACALNSAVLQLADKVMSPGRDRIAATLTRIQNSTYPEVARRSRQLLAENFSAGERHNASMNPLERTLWQFVAVGAAVHAACQADEACRKRAASMSSGSPDDEARRLEADRKAQDKQYEGALRAAQSDPSTMYACFRSEAFCRSKY